MDSIDLASELYERSQDTGWMDDGTGTFGRQIRFPLMVSSEVATIVAQAVLLYDTPWLSGHRGLELGQIELDPAGVVLTLRLQGDWRVPAATTKSTPEPLYTRNRTMHAQSD